MSRMPQLVPFLVALLISLLAPLSLSAQVQQASVVVDGMG